MKAAFRPDPQVPLVLTAHGESPCLDYAAAEAARLLGRLGVTVTRAPAAAGQGFALTLAADATAPHAPALRSLRHDGYALAVAAGGVTIAAPTAKGVLNGVYDLAERLGFVFLLPGDAGEWVPAPVRPVPAGVARVVPRFPHRGIFGGLDVWPFSPEEWLRFFAKLRFNAQSDGPQHAALAATLGIRLEVGGHGMASLLPRDLFATQPELFRMFQPEDFGGKRTPDSNFCPTNPVTARHVRENFARQLAALPANVYAVHAWADDLPGGGWCMCSRCRAFTPSDQSLLAMNLQAAVVRAERRLMRVPAIAYHDTMYPGHQIAPARECFLLYAPRERCYAHALDDPHCAKNRWYRGALDGWMRAFARHDDAHTFEYYNDQILFRGLYPFVPDVVLGDMAEYERAGITSHMSLQVGGAALAPDHNLLAFARAHWDAKLTPAALIADLARQFDPARPAPWRRFLQARRAAYTAALAVCDAPNDVYGDYRFMPELGGAVGVRVSRLQAAGAAKLLAAAEALAAAAPGLAPRAAELAAREVARARFEAADLQAMSLHQDGLTRLTAYLNTGDHAVLRDGLAQLERALAQLDRAAAAASACGLPAKGPYYLAFNRDWTQKEIREKLRVYRQALS